MGLGLGVCSRSGVSSGVRGAESAPGSGLRVISRVWGLGPVLRVNFGLGNLGSTVWGQLWGQGLGVGAQGWGSELGLGVNSRLEGPGLRHRSGSGVRGRSGSGTLGSGPGCGLRGWVRDNGSRFKGPGLRNQGRGSVIKGPGWGFRFGALGWALGSGPGLGAGVRGSGVGSGSGALGSKVWGQGSGFECLGLGLGGFGSYLQLRVGTQVWGSGLGLRVSSSSRVSSGFRVSGSAPEFGSAPSSGAQCQGLESGLQVQGPFWVFGARGQLLGWDSGSALGSRALAHNSGSGPGLGLGLGLEGLGFRLSVGARVYGQRLRVCGQGSRVGARVYLRARFCSGGHGSGSALGSRSALGSANWGRGFGLVLRVKA